MLDKKFSENKHCYSPPAAPAPTPVPTPAPAPILEVPRKPVRPTHLNLSLQDLFTHNDTELVPKTAEKVTPNAELLSTPENPLPESNGNHHDDLKDYIASFAPTSQPPPALISPKNAELLIPTTTKLPNISNSDLLIPTTSKMATISTGSNSGND